MPLLTDLLNRFLGASSTDGNQQQTANDFERVALNIGPDALSKGLSAAFGSNLTPDASQMVSQMFGASSPDQRAAMLNHLIATLGPAASSVLGGVLQGANIVPGVGPAVTAEQALQINPQQIQAAVSQAQQHNPGIVDALSGFYSQHPGLVKTLGSAALAVALGKISEHMKA
ncbi:MAG: hypothetical protein LBQ20_11710 [Rhodanobacter sp.]|jgi:hypothetical protein|nr:hypothetical protein [Rhodanobacter sp.]